MMIINGWFHIGILAIAMAIAAISGDPTHYAKFMGVEFIGAHATFLGLMLKWFIACGLVEFFVSIYALIGTTLKRD